MKPLGLLIAVHLTGFISCITPKDARILKHSTKEWRGSKVVLQGYQDTPFSGSFLILRENGKFEHTSSGLLRSFEAGSWTKISSDQIALTYVNGSQSVVHNPVVIIDRATATLIFDGDSMPVPQMRMRLMFDEL